MTDWRAEAACRGADADLFFPDEGDRASVAAAREMCAPCPVRAPCLDAALTFGLVPGIWGGTSERERRGMRRRRRFPL